MITIPYSIVRNALLIVILISVSLTTACGGGSSKKVNCDDFETQPEAQAYFIANNASNLDRDNDGIACEHLPDKKSSKTALDLNYFVGSYILLGEICEDHVCRAEAIELTIDYNNKIIICSVREKEKSCINELPKPVKPILDSYSFEFDEGTLRFDQNLLGHLRLKLHGDSFYGHQDIYSDSFRFNLNLPDNFHHSLKNNRYFLSSLFGQRVKWSPTDGLVVEYY